MILYPYLYMVFVVAFFIVAIVSSKIDTDASIDFFPAIVTSCVFGVIVTIVCFIKAIVNSICFAYQPETYPFAVKMNLLVKCWQIPAYCVNFFIGMIGLLMSVWGIPVILLMVLIDFLTIAISGTNAVGMCIALYRNGRLSFGKCIMSIVLSYIYVLDVIVAIVLSIKHKA